MRLDSPDRGWLASAAEIDALRREAPEGVVVEPSRGDFPSLLMNCALSISQGGYNTMMECLRAGCRTLVVPYAGGHETEQTLRADLLEKRGTLTVLPEAEMTVESLAKAISNGRRISSVWAGSSSTRRILVASCVMRRLEDASMTISITRLPVGRPH